MSNRPRSFATEEQVTATAPDEAQFSDLRVPGYHGPFGGGDLDALDEAGNESGAVDADGHVGMTDIHHHAAVRERAMDLINSWKTLSHDKIEELKGYLLDLGTKAVDALAKIGDSLDVHDHRANNSEEAEQRDNTTKSETIVWANLRQRLSKLMLPIKQKLGLAPAQSGDDPAGDSGGSTDVA